MRLFVKDSYFETPEFQNGFESFDFNQADQLTNDGWSMGGSSKDDWNVVTAQGGNPRTGSNSFNWLMGAGASGAGSVNIYRSVAAGKSFKAEYWFYFESGACAGDNFGAYFQFDDGDGNDDVEDPTNYILMSWDHHCNDGLSAWSHFTIFTRFGGGDRVSEFNSDHEINYGFENTYVGVQFIIEGGTTYKVYLDIGDTGVWTLFCQGVFSNTGTLGNLDVFRYMDMCDDTADPSLEIDDIEVHSLAIVTGAEITSNITTCFKSVAGGMFAATINDYEMANIATIPDYLWNKVEIKTNDLSEVIWEGAITHIKIARNTVHLTGYSYTRILDRILAEYNAAFATGEVTAISDPTITDSEAAFSGLNSKVVSFTDSQGPDDEKANPNSSSAIKESDYTTGLTPDYQAGTYVDTVDTTDSWRISDGHNNYKVILEFTLAEAASVAKLAFYFNLGFSQRSYYTTIPAFYIYNDDGAAWEKVSDFDWNEGRGPIEYSFDSDDLDDAVLGHYFSGTTLKMAIDAGVCDGIVELVQIFIAEITNIYGTPFEAEEEIYTIDASTATTLTFTGQTPQTDGVSVKDRYAVGDYLHNIMNNIWNAAQITYLVLDFANSTLMEASDLRDSSVGDTLNSFANRMDRKWWQSIGWTISCPSSYTDSGIDLTETDIFVDINMEGYNIEYDGMQEYKKIKLVGNGINVSDFTTPSHDTPISKIINDPAVAMQGSAKKALANLLTKHGKEFQSPEVTVDLNRASAPSSYSNRDIGKTLDINLFTGGYQKTALFIRELHYQQLGKDHLLCTFKMEEVT